MDLKVYIILMLAGAFALFMVIETTTLFLATKKMNLGIKTYTVLGKAWFQISSFTRKNTTYILGWLPIMTVSAQMVGMLEKDEPGEEVFEEEQKFRNKTGGQQFLVSALVPISTVVMVLLLIPFISSETSYVENVERLWFALETAFRFFFFDIDYTTFITNLKASAAHTNDFIYVTCFVFIWIVLMTFSGTLTAWIAQTTQGNKSATPMLIILTLGQLAVMIFILFSLFKVAFSELGIVDTIFLSAIFSAVVLAAGATLFFLLKMILPKD
jgi:hypothetical protein